MFANGSSGEGQDYRHHSDALDTFIAKYLETIRYNTIFCNTLLPRYLQSSLRHNEYTDTTMILLSHHSTKGPAL